MKNITLLSFQQKKNTWKQIYLPADVWFEYTINECSYDPIFTDLNTFFFTSIPSSSDIVMLLLVKSVY